MRISPESFPIIQGHTPIVADGLGDLSDAISLENATGVLIIVQQYYGGDTDLVLTVHEGATAVEAAAGTYAISATFPIWINTDTSTSDALVRQTDAATITIDTGAHKDQMVAMYVPARILTDGRPWVALGSSGGNNSSLVSALYILDGARYQQTTPPTAIA